MNRRDILRAIALGGGIVAGELWVPGAKLILLPGRPELNERNIEELCLRYKAYERFSHAWTERDFVDNWFRKVIADEAERRAYLIGEALERSRINAIRILHSEQSLAQELFDGRFTQKIS